MGYFQHVKSLLFQQQPNYSHLRQLFTEEIEKTEDKQSYFMFDWEQQEGCDPLDSIPAIEEEGKVS